MTYLLLAILQEIQGKSVIQNILVNSLVNTQSDRNNMIFSNSSNQNANHALWNAMLYPLTKMAARGAIWYQGK
jgi:hypothetical protein